MLCTQSVVVCPNSCPPVFQPVEITLGKNINSEVREVTYRKLAVGDQCVRRARGVGLGWVWWEATTWGERAQKEQLEKFDSKTLGDVLRGRIFILQR